MTGILAGRCALVTGASSGLGVDFAHELAALGARLVLVARREEQLRQVQRDIQAKHGVDVVTVALDLGDGKAPPALYDLVRQQKLQVDVLVNNAGFGTYGPELDVAWDKTNQMLQLDIVALTHLTKLFARDMVKRRYGYILQVASVGAYQPSPFYAAYSAAKSYVLSFGQALNCELRGSGVSCTVISPGATATEFLQVSGQKTNPFFSMTVMTSAEVARAGIRAMLKRRYSVIPGFINKLMMLLVRLTPDPINARVAAYLMKHHG